MESLWATTGILASFPLVVSLLILRRCLGFAGKALALEAGMLSLVLIAGLWVAHPYIHDGHVGAGDSYHYGLQVADFVAQTKHGMFPVLIGQSEFGFNGNVHTLRTAPYFTHFAGLLDWLTLHRLSFFALQNLTAVLSIIGAGLSAYLCVRLLAPAQRWLGAPLGFLYASCPALAAALYGSDMFATAMAAPWIPFFFLGLTRSLRELDDTQGLLLSVLSLALIWYAHPAIGAWLSIFLFAVQAWRMVAVGGAPGNMLRPILGAAAMVALLSYLLYSVESLDLGYHDGNAGNEAVASVLRSIDDAFPGAFLPVAQAAGNEKFQIGYALGLALLAGLGAGLRHGPASKGMAIMAGFLVIGTLPVPWLTAQFWAWIPRRLVDVTNVWPMQRFYLILSALAVIAAAEAAGRTRSWTRAMRSVVICGLLAGCAWSAAEITTFHRHIAPSVINPEESAQSLYPENALLTRSSYLLFGKLPPAFSHGWVDPEFASRLRDETMAPMADNADTLLRAREGLDPLLPLTGLVGDIPVVIPPGRDVLLRFEFASPDATGEIKLSGGGIRRNYLLPASGEPRAFGAKAGAAHTLTIRRVPDRERTVVLSTGASGVSVEALAFDSAQLPINLQSLVPFSASVTAPQPGYLETPQVFVPGYIAQVNGREVAIDRTLDGLVAVPIPAGKSEVTISYPGPRGLRTLWFISTGNFVALTLISTIAQRRTRQTKIPNDITPEALRTYNLAVTWVRTPRSTKAITCVVAISLVGGIIALNTHRSTAADLAAFGSLRLTVELPNGGGPQPLIVTGRASAADCLYIIPEGDGRFRFGIDHWGIGGPVSDPIQLQPGRFHTIELTAGGLFPRQHPDYGRFGAQVRPDVRAPTAPLRLVVDGQVVFDRRLPFHPAAPDEVTLGANTIGLSACGPVFEGRIVRAERFLPDFFTDSAGVVFQQQPKDHKGFESLRPTVELTGSSGP